MKIRFVVACVISLFFVSYANATCLEDASVFAERVCGEIAKTGESTTVTGTGKITANTNFILKTIVGASGDLQGKIKTNTYVGVVRKELGKDRFNTLDCRKNLALAAIKSQCNRKNVTFKKCPRPEFGLVKWSQSAEANENSGWRGSGHNRGEWCNELAGRLIGQRRIGSPNQVTVLGTDESRRKKWGNPSYNYKCHIRVDYEPIYNAKTDPLCGFVGIRS